MLRQLTIALAFPPVIWRRLLSHLGLALAVWSGMTLAVGMVVSIPVYAEASGYRILLAALTERVIADPLPPFAMVYRYGGASDPSISWQQYLLADQLAGNLPAAGIDLPAPPGVRFAATEKLRVGFPDGAGREVLFARIGFLSGIERHIQIVDGDLPRPFTGDGPLDVLVSETTAAKNTLLIDDLYRVESTGRGPRIDMIVRIAGIWRPADADAGYWFQTPSAYSDVFLVPEESFALIANVPDARFVTLAAWYTAIDGSSVRSSDVERLRERIVTATADIQQRLPGAQLVRSPVEALERHRDQVRILTVTLALFAVPLLVVIGYFVLQVAGMTVVRQQQEMAILRSRGSSRWQVAGLALGEVLLLGAAAWAAGLPLGLLLAHMISWTVSFLQFAPLDAPPPTLLPASPWHALATVLLALPAVVLPALSAAGRTIISYKSERARATRPPLWQRLYLDILLLIPAVYGYQQLRLSGMIGVPGVTVGTDDPFRNPLLLLAPALMVFAGTLVGMRFLPLLLRALAWMAGLLPGVAIVTALRFLARTPGAYGGPALLVALTLALATFTSSMALTLDRYSEERAYYRGAADVRLAYPGAAITSANIAGDREIAPAETSLDLSGGALSTTGEADTTPSTAYLFVPIEEYLTIPGVTGATRVAPGKVDIIVGSARPISGIFYGVDRTTLAAVLADAWRPDYADESLGALMNRLADYPDAALVSETFATQQGLRIGDRFTLAMNDRGQTQNITFTVVGMLRYFPTLYDQGPPFVIGNLDYSFDSQGGMYPYEVWLSLDSDAGLQTVAAAGIGYGLRMIRSTPQTLLDLDLRRPERQGLFGLLSVGFLATTVVTVIGFVAYTLLSFQRRLVESGVLRAIGLSTQQLSTMLVFEQMLVVGFGAALGTIVGVLTSRLFIPFLQVRTGVYPETPPFVVQIDWERIALVYGISGGLLAATIVVIVLLLRRMRIFEAVKLGEAV
ncbi:MAG: FtsX-like permease family protein [Roseiflexus sp.]